MGQLTNQYVSQSYQGLLKMTNSTTGVTGTLQTVQTGDGTDTPLQISKTEVNISGSLTVNGAPVSFNTGSLVTTASFNAYTSSNDSKVNSLIAATGSFVTEAESGSFLVTGSVSGNVLTFTKGNGSTFPLTVNTGSLPAGVVSGSAQVAAFGYATTSSVSSSIATLSGSIATTDLGQNNRLTSIEGITGSFATTSSLTSLSSSIATTDLGQNNRLGSLESKTGSYATTSSVDALTGSINSLNAATSSFVTETESGSFLITGSVSGNTLTFTKGNGTSFNLQVDTGSNSNRNGLITTGSVGGSQSITGSLTMTGSIDITGSLHSTDIIGTGSLFLKPNQSDARYLEVYNTSPTDTHITASGGQIFLGDDQTYVKVDNYGSVERIDVVAGNELVVSSSITNLTGSLHQSGTFYPGVINWVNSPIVQSTGSYILTTNISGVTEYDSYQNVASALQPYLTTGSLPSGVVSGSAQIVELGFATTGSNVFQGNQTISGSLIVTGSITALSASFTYLETIYQTSSIIFSSGSNILGDEAGDTQTLNGVVNIPLGNLNVTGATTSSLGFFGNLQGTASYATNALSASNSVNSDSSISSSFAQIAISSSQAANAVSASQAQSAVSSSYSNNSTSSSYSNNSTSASYASNATSASFSQNTISGSFSNFAVSSSFASNALSSSHAINADTASYFNGLITSSSYAVTSSISFDLVVYGKCDNPGGLTKGTIVRITGANGDNPLFNSASWTNDPTSANTLGMLTADVAYNAFANVVTQGTVIGINTSGMTAGDLLFLSSSGQYTTSSVPAPYHEVRLGQVLRPQLNNGSAYISIDNGYELTELHDVDITSPVSGDLLVYRSGSYGQWVNETGGELGFATTSSVNQKLDTGSFNSYTASMDARTGSYITTGSAASTQSITGSLILSGSAGPELDVKGDVIITGSLNVRSGSLSTISNNTTIDINLYLTSSQAGQVNIIKGWSENPNAGGAGAVQANYTGSLRITGSNNIVSMPQIRATGVGGGTDQQGYISGSDNIIATNSGGIYLNTGSLIFPRITGNYLGTNANILMNFTTSSLSGGHPNLTGNLLHAGTITINSNSGSITSFSNNSVNGGSITSTQNFVTNTRPSISNNNVISTIILNHISSSINYQNNYNNSPVTVNNHLSSSNITNNSLTVSNNLIFGGSSSTGLGIWVSGSQSSNATRNIIDNLIGGKNIIVSSSFVSSSNSNLVSSLIYGQNLIVSGNHAATVGGSTFLGRYNDTGSLALAQDIVFAVGTGTGTATRRTGLWIDSGSLVGISGSHQVIGNTTMTGSLTVSGSVNITGSVQGNVNALSIASSTASLNLNDGNFFTLQLVSGSNTFINPSNIKAGQTINILLSTTGSGTVTFPTSVLQVSGSSYTPTTTTGKDIITLVSFDSTNLYLANVKNLV